MKKNKSVVLYTASSSRLVQDLESFMNMDIAPDGQVNKPAGIPAVTIPDWLMSIGINESLEVHGEGGMCVVICRRPKDAPFTLIPFSLLYSVEQTEDVTRFFFSVDHYAASKFKTLIIEVTAI